MYVEGGGAHANPPRKFPKMKDDSASKEQQMKRLGLVFALAVAASCGDDRLIHSAMGVLKVTVLNAGSAANAVAVTLRCDADSRDERAAVASPTLIKIDELSPGTCQARIGTLGANDVALRSVWVSDLVIAGGRTTEITVDLADAVVGPQPVELCNGIDDDGDGQVDKPKEKLLLCSQCVGNMEMPAADDARCAAIPCGEFFAYELRGSAANGFTCVKASFDDVTDRCEAVGTCLVPGEQTCRAKGTKKEDVVASLQASDVCKKIDGCAAKTAPTVANQPDGTPCGTAKACKAGVCACAPQCSGKACGDDGCGGSCGACGTDTACSAGGQCVSTKPEAGCSDGTREGFQSLTEYPAIASCSGGWSVGGVTRDDLAPACDRKSGNNGQNMEGTGCSAADLCAVGWHVCRGKTEVAAKAGAKGCADSVPTGSPDKAMFFAVQQHSAQFSQCDDASAGDNDVFGCGNLGIALTGDKGCGVLTRALASMKAGSCGYNEAEPGLGPWQCLGAAGSDIHEGGLVTKSGCPGSSCTWEGSPTGNWDRGGVLCCKD